MQCLKLKDSGGFVLAERQTVYNNVLIQVQLLQNFIFSGSVPVQVHQL